jgi:hypothetical protein
MAVAFGTFRLLPSVNERLKMVGAILADVLENRH